MDRWCDRVALVTGAGSGIGEAVTKLLADAGMKVVACDIKKERLDELSKERPNMRPYKVKY